MVVPPLPHPDFILRHSCLALGFVAPLGVFGPLFGKKEFKVDEAVSLCVAEADEDRDLAVFDLACTTTPLTFDAYLSAALFEETVFVDGK